MTLNTATKIEELLPLIVGTTKKELAAALDKANPLFSFNTESGLSSYHNYTRNELVRHCITWGVDPLSEHTKMGRTIKWQKKYAEVTGTEFKNYNAHIHQG